MLQNAFNQQTGMNIQTYKQTSTNQKTILVRMPQHITNVSARMIAKSTNNHILA